MENVAMAAKRELGATFDSAALLYQQARPDYPEALFEAVIASARLRPGDHLLEIGCATGKATLPFARRGFRLTCVEMGKNLAAVARRNLAGLSAEVVQARFEDWEPAPGAAYPLIFAATAWSWLDPAVRYRKAWRLLQPGGHLALWNAAHVFPPGGDPFFREIQDVYDEIGEGLPPGARWPAPGELPDYRAEIEATGLFDDVTVRHFDWECVYDADSYIALLDTFSGHISMERAGRERLYSEIRRRLARRGDGLLRRHWGAALHVARRRHPAPP
jgi:SAM-dependent methyltransferase